MNNLLLLVLGKVGTNWVYNKKKQNRNKHNNRNIGNVTQVSCLFAKNLIAKL